ncbi:archease [bacterium]|nr:archease [bacterium]
MRASDAGFELVEHPADIGIRFWGRTLGEAFVQAALALRVMLAGEGEVRETHQVALEAAGEDRLEVLFNWLSELLVRFDADQLILGRFEVQAVSEQEIRAVGYGEPYDLARHETPYYVKAITYHQMALEQGKGGWQGQVYVDI